MKEKKKIMKNFYESERQCWTDRKRSLPLNKKWTERLAGAAAVSERSAIEFLSTVVVQDKKEN